MGRKVHPRAFRLGTIYTWNSRWFADDKKRYQELLLEDETIREAMYKRLEHAGLSRVEIKRSINTADITLHVARPGMVIGRGGKRLEKLKEYVSSLVKKKSTLPVKVELHVEPVKEPDLDARLVAESIANQLVRRFPYKRVVSRTISRVMSAGAKGVKIVLSGRIAGSEIARTVRFQEGSVPLSTIREKIDFAKVPALTKSGYIGVKVWISLP